MIRVLVADDHPLFLDGLKSRLREESDIQVVAEAKTGTEVLRELRKKVVDVAILDISLPEKDGLVLMTEIRTEYPKLPVVFLTMHPVDQFGVQAMRSGASGYLTKETAHRDLVSAIRTVYNGGRHMDRRLADELLNEVVRDRSEEEESLTQRELQILRLIASGLNPKKIAAQLKLSAPTVYTHRKRILRKIGVETDAQLVRFAISKNIAM
jgi:DNA-binding NarL/FixJ family response regulator